MAGEVNVVNVLVATALIPPAVVDRLASELPAGVGVSYAPVPWDEQFSSIDMPDEWRELVRVAHVLVGFPQQVKGLVEKAPQLRWVQYYGAGYERAPLDELGSAGIGLVSAAGAGADGVAEFAVMAMLSLARKAPSRYVAQQHREWVRFRTAELAGRRATIVGAGEIGTRLCRLSAALGLSVTCVRRRPEAGCPPGAQRVVPPDALVSVLPDTDVLVLAAALTDETEPLGAEAFDAICQGAILVNVGRGGLVQHDALLAALESGRLGGAWLDVLPLEPLPPTHPLWTGPNVVVTAHDATATESYPWNVAKLTAVHIRQWLAGKPMSHTVLPPGAPPVVAARFAEE
jgi:phosphoglycerate dehydrogenase-like enzyme